jgi:hypothetical protein
MLERRPGVALAVAVTCSLLLSACTGSGESDRARPTLLASQKPVKAEANPFGLKWNWAQLDVLREGLIAAAGGASFYEFEWCGVEPREGERDFAEVDARVDGMVRLGYKPLLKIRTGACWVNGGGAGDTPAKRKRKTPSAMPEDLDVYKAFVADVVKRYSPKGVKAYAIENEVNARNFWRGTPEEYTELLRAGAAAVREADPDVAVLDGGLSSIGYGPVVAGDLLDAGRSDEAVAFWQAFFARRFDREEFVFEPADTPDELRRVLATEPAKRAREYFAATAEAAADLDAWQLHYYEPWEFLPTVLGAIRARVPAGLAIEAWEVGIAWPGGTFDAEAAAHETVQLLASGQALGVGRLIYLPAAYTPGGLRDEEIWRGLWEPTGKPRPAADAYLTLVKSSAGAVGVPVPVPAGNLAGVAYDHGAASKTVVWASGGSGRLTGPPPPGAKVVSLSGEDVKWPAAGLSLGAAPVVVELPLPATTAVQELAQRAA